MEIMDLSINQEAMGVQNRFGNQVFKLNKFDETDVKGNNNLYNSRKTDTDNDSGSLFKDGYSSENLQVDPSLFSYSSFKKAMDLRTHSRSDGENKRTIFDDADYFAKNFFYKLLPITFEQVDEAIIHTEHNYSLFSLNSESEAEEDCSRTMDYSQIKEKNYKRRRTKFKEGSDEEVWDGNEDSIDSSQNIPNQKEAPVSEPEPVPENTILPLDLSTAPPVQEQKTDNSQLCRLKEHPGGNEESLSSKLKCIQVTITRPDEKENYQPCDMFLNDIARLVPRLINNDCFEIDILDKTGDRHDDFRKHRLYYIISESTWRLFQSTRERVILTNDHTLGPPLKIIEKDERPTFLVFDQFSLAKCLAEYCEEIGGCFEYTCIEEEKEENVKGTKMIELVTKAIEMDRKKERIIEMDEEETQTNEVNIKSEEVVAEEIILEGKKSGTDEKDKSAEDIEIYSKESNEEIETEAQKLEKFNGTEEEGDTKEEKINAEETEKPDLETCEIKTNAMEKQTIFKTDTEDLMLNSHPRKRILRRKKRKQRKKAEINAKEKKNSGVEAEDIKSDIFPEKIGIFKLEHGKAATTVNTDETKVAAVDADDSELNNMDTKETKEVKMKLHTEDVKLFETGETETIEMNLEKGKKIEKGSVKRKPVDEIKSKEIKTFVGETGSDKVSAEKVQELKRKNKESKRRDLKKNKNFKKTVEDLAEETKATFVNVQKKGTDEVKEIKGNKRKKVDEEEMRKIKRIRKSKRESEVDKKDSERARKRSRSIGEGKKTEVKKKRKLEEEEKVDNLRRVKKRVKSRKEASVSLGKMKTRLKSTSELETSQKPNKEIEEAKRREEEFPVGGERRKRRGGRNKGGGESRRDEVEMKEKGRRVRGRKRELKEEEKEGKMVEERCLRSRGRKEEVEISGKRKKR